MLGSPRRPLEEKPYPASWKNRLYYLVQNYLVQISLLATTFFVLTQLGSFIEQGQRGMMPIQLSSGFFFVALLLFGIRLWPGIILGILVTKFFAEISLSAVPVTGLELIKIYMLPLILTVFEAIGETLNAVVAVWLLKYFKFQYALARVYDILLFTIIAVIVSPLLGASFSSIGLWITDRVDIEFIGQIWLIDWLCKGVGILVFSPTLLVWRRLPPSLYADIRSLEWSLLLLCLAVVSGLTLKSEQGGDRLVLLYMILPFTVWAAIRFEQHGATLATLLVTGVLLNGGLNRTIKPEHGITIDYTKLQDVTLEVGFIAIIAFTAFMVAATYVEQRQTTEKLSDEQEYLFAILRALANAVIIVDVSGHITYFNPVAQQITGWRRELVFDKPIAEVFWLKNINATISIENWVKQGLKGKKLAFSRQTLLTQNQEEKLITLAITPIRQRSGKVMGITITFMELMH